MLSSLEIRKAKLADLKMISNLLGQLGYTDQDYNFEKRYSQLLNHADEVILVAASLDKVYGFISIHFIPQLAFEGDFARVSYFSVDQTMRNQQIGQKLLAQAENIAIQRGCNRMELHCAVHRQEAHEFYKKRNYIESPKYFMKKL